MQISYSRRQIPSHRDYVPQKIGIKFFHEQVVMSISKNDERLKVSRGARSIVGYVERMYDIIRFGRKKGTQ